MTGRPMTLCFDMKNLSVSGFLSDQRLFKCVLLFRIKYIGTKHLKNIFSINIILNISKLNWSLLCTEAERRCPKKMLSRLRRTTRRTVWLRVITL